MEKRKIELVDVSEFNRHESKELALVSVEMDVS